MANPSLDAAELAAARRDNTAALVELLQILKRIDDRYGRLDMIDANSVGRLDSPQRPLRLATRFAALLGQLILDRDTELSPVIFEQLCIHHRWIDLFFSLSGFGSPDYLVPMLSAGEGNARRVASSDLSRFLTIFSAASGMDINLDECLKADAAAAISAYLGILGTRFCFTPNEHAFRERLLAWLPGKMNVVRLGQIALQTMASPYMHCSYAMSAAKHDIKADMIAQMSRACREWGCPEYDPAEPRQATEKPTIVVTCENFTYGHSIFRTHSRSVRALKEKFRVVGVVYAAHISPPVEACFDEVIRYPDGAFPQAVKETAEAIHALRPDMVLHLGVGMSPYVIALASIRLAPAQACSFGHTATTKSPVIDYMILPDDFVGDPACFSEELVLVPPSAMPYEPRDDVDFAALKQRMAAEGPPEGPIRIAVPASAMKLGPPFFEALKRCEAAASAPVAFHVFPLGCAGLGYHELKRRLGEQMPSAVVHEELPYPDYIAELARCAFFVCPFPYGNMNSIIDAALVGLPGVCLDGPEAHAHADVAYFRRMGFPKALATGSLDEYVAAIVRLVDDPKWLARCRKTAAAVDLDAAFFTGDTGPFVEAAAGLIARGRAASPAELETAS